jgi:phage shock protein B
MPEILAGTFGASLILFVLIVMPIWIFLHYRQRARQLMPPPPVSTADAGDLTLKAERMEQRITALEAMLDAESPGWRKNS